MAPLAAIPVWVYASIAAAGAVYGGVKAKQSADFNAKIATQEANYAIQKGKADEEQHLDRLKKSMADGKVAVANSGVSLLSGSAQDVFDENLEEGLYDAVMIRYGAEASSRSLLAKASGLRSEGQAAMVSGLLKAAGSIASAGSSSTSGMGAAQKAGIGVGHA